MQSEMETILEDGRISKFQRNPTPKLNHPLIDLPAVKKSIVHRDTVRFKKLKITVIFQFDVQKTVDIVRHLLPQLPSNLLHDFFTGIYFVIYISVLQDTLLSLNFFQNYFLMYLNNK